MARTAASYRSGRKEAARAARKTWRALPKVTNQTTRQQVVTIGAVEGRRNITNDDLQVFGALTGKNQPATKPIDLVR